ncbi:MAG: hypothetical protein R2769_02560 [Saprospiraceae bacterium]
MSDSTTTIRYSDADLQEFKQVIEKKMERTREELNYLQEQIQDLNETSSNNQSGDWFDDSSLHSDIEMLSNMAARQRQFLEALEAAMIRIKNKTYGICTVTGKLIDKKRLLIVPHATKSLEAKEIEATGGEKKPKTAIPPKAKEKSEAAPEKKIITKVIKRSGSSTAAPKKIDDDDDDFDLIDDPKAKFDDFEDDDDDMDDVDMDNMADDDGGDEDFDDED